MKKFKVRLGSIYLGMPGKSIFVMAHDRKGAEDSILQTKEDEFFIQEIKEVDYEIL